MKNLKADTGSKCIKVFKSKISIEEAKEIALHSKDQAFGLIHKAKSYFSKGNLITVSRVEKQYYPFWHIVAENYQEYKKKNRYSFQVEPEVRSVKVNGKSFDISGEPICTIEAEDLCVEHHKKEIVADATNAKRTDLEQYLGFDSKEIQETEELMGKGKVVIPAEVKASFLVRELFKDIIKPIHADKIINEKVGATTLILYFRPTIMVELKDTVSGNVGTLEVDALTKNVSKGFIINKELKEIINEDVLFDLSQEIASTIVPGVGFGMAVGKKLKKKYDKKKKQEKMESSAKAYKDNKKN